MAGSAPGAETPASTCTRLIAAIHPRSVLSADPPPGRLSQVQHHRLGMCGQWRQPVLFAPGDKQAPATSIRTSGLFRDRVLEHLGRSSDQSV